jgi:hypothetical protein
MSDFALKANFYVLLVDLTVCFQSYNRVLVLILQMEPWRKHAQIEQSLLC